MGAGKLGVNPGAENAGPNVPVGEVAGRAGGYVSGGLCWAMAVPAKARTDKLIKIAENGRPHRVSP